MIPKYNKIINKINTSSLNQISIFHFYFARKQYLGDIATLNQADRTNIGRLSQKRTPGTGVSIYNLP